MALLDILLFFILVIEEKSDSSYDLDVWYHVGKEKRKQEKSDFFLYLLHE